MHMWRDNENNSLLSLAVKSKSPEMFHTVMACVDHDLSPQEVCNVNPWKLGRQNIFGITISQRARRQNAFLV